MTPTRALTVWEGVTVEHLRADWGAPMLTVFDHVGSTNDVALEEAARGAPTGSIVIANHQSNGRGQYGRLWESNAGHSLLMTVIAPLEAPSLEPVRDAALLATTLAIRGLVNAEVVRKSPNDVMSPRRRKLAGLLVEPSADGRAVVGIGVNVSHAATDFSEELRESADSLRLLGSSVIRRDVAEAIVRRLQPVLSKQPRTDTAHSSSRTGRVTTIDRLVASRDGDDHGAIWIR